MSFVIRGIAAEPFRPLFDLPDDALAAAGAVRVTADVKPGFPCRVSLSDAEPGETLLLVNYEHQPAATPYRSCHAIFVAERAGRRALFDNELPASLIGRLISLRAFDAQDMMRAADCLQGTDLGQAIDAMFADPDVAYLHAHNAKRGCFAARIDRRPEP